MMDCVTEESTEFLAEKKVSKYQKNLLHNLITSQDVKDVARSVWGNDATVTEYNIHPYCKGKIGFLGTHLQLHVTVEIGNQKKKDSFFVKTVPYDVNTHAEYVLEKDVFTQEIIFYDELIPLLREACPDNEQWTPICYKTKKDLIIFEDLARRGYAMRDKLFDKELVIAALSSIARMHAASLLKENQLGVPLNEAYPHAFQEKVFVRTGKSYEWLIAGVDAIVAVAEYLNLDSKSLRAACEEVFEAIKPSPTKKNVISHGDLWGNNMMFNDKTPPQCLLIDFQLLRYSPLAQDVIGLLYLCTSQKFRELWEKDMVRHYHTILCEILNANRYRQELPSWSELWEGIEEQRLGAVITAALYFQTILIDEDISTKIMNDPDRYFEFEFRSRSKTIIETVKKNPNYGSRIAEIIVELVDLASRLDQLPKPS